MNECERVMLIDAEPDLVADLQVCLALAGYANLAAKLATLSIWQQNDSRYGSDFYTAPRTEGPWGPDHKTLSFRSGDLNVDVVGGDIVLVEVLRKPNAILPG